MTVVSPEAQVQSLLENGFEEFMGNHPRYRIIVGKSGRISARGSRGTSCL